jgi:nicotinate-nucleotide adenylyltransferase
MREVRMVLSANPPHREAPELSAERRFELLSLAVSQTPELVADASELSRAGPSYMVDTLRLMRSQESELSIALVLGMEAFNGLQTWYQWEELLGFAHIVVTDRAGFDNALKPELEVYVRQHKAADKAQLKQLTHGKIHIQPVSPLNISATHIRKLIEQGKSVKQLLPPHVWQYVQRKGYYGAKTNFK